jgi:hypothetical protein
MVSQQVSRLCISCLILVVHSGCSDERLPLGKVSGTVTLDGALLERGMVHFIPRRGPAASGVVRRGAYVLSTYESGDGAMLGQHTVYFAPDPDESYMASYTPEDYAAGKLPPQAPPCPLPPQYLNPSASGLSVNVVEGKNIHDFHLQTAARRD